VQRLENIRRVELDYFDGKDWKPDWNFRRLLRLPQALRLHLVMLRKIPGGLREEPMDLVVPIPVERDVGIR
jgi:hypothetical protein